MTMSEIPFLNSVTYQVIVDVLLMILLYCVVLMMCSRRRDARGFGLLFLMPLMLTACTFNAMMIMGRCEVDNEPAYLKAIGDFKEAQKVLVDKESVLNRLVEPRIKKLMAEKDIDGLHCLVEGLPLGYKGSRQVYYAMELIIEEGKKNDKKR